MIYNDFLGNKISRLGFGTMRYPLNEDKTVDVEQVRRMTEYAYEHGVNYFDTAWPYHGGVSETVIGECLKKYPRDSFYLADKYPGHQTAPSYDPAEIFEAQLKKCQVEYFDYYLLHNVCENSFDVYKDDRWKIVDYFVEQKKLGRIRHLGFSSHSSAEHLIEVLDYLGNNVEFCQIQCNYLDWTLQDAAAKYETLTKRGMPIVIMEPIRGGKLAELSEDAMAKLKALDPGETAAGWALRFLKSLPNAKVTLSGMSSFEQMVENVATYDGEKSVTAEEKNALLEVAESMKDSLPCTGCRYCTAGCPMGLDIPSLISSYNDLRFAKAGFTVGMMIDSLPEDKKPHACIGCGACSRICPQKIDIPAAMADFVEKLESMPHWADICRERAEAAARLKAQKEEK